ncbi:hypothetical protein CFP56_034700 [Quercus suber]|uniref:Uncharacterized protein n=1 Tax=Quercus suber TaxID=58331 RepID=A0AAW0JBD5_QUESU
MNWGKTNGNFCLWSVEEKDQRILDEYLEYKRQIENENKQTPRHLYTSKHSMQMQLDITKANGNKYLCYLVYGYPYFELLRRVSGNRFYGRTKSKFVVYLHETWTFKIVATLTFVAISLNYRDKNKASCNPYLSNTKVSFIVNDRVPYV